MMGMGIKHFYRQEFKSGIESLFGLGYQEPGISGEKGSRSDDWLARLEFQTTIGIFAFFLTLLVLFSYFQKDYLRSKKLPGAHFS
jgi:hypothetical protein